MMVLTLFRPAALQRPSTGLFLTIFRLQGEDFIV
jgi:hypothetical protein